ncbi:hypothetical protein NP511_02100 [Natrinema thermotolerans]|uniref:Uncharacterized protein n=1 Tax=Natrinema thermotolerans TaxID=121872 RepID=A0AAF0PFT5_9EURY|nr:hypothetical protein [Natrinema thermotolerans]WPH65852.1 hypothetical protein HJTV4_gp29 [Haloarchaeal virus HJTV-4]QCC60757.1 hypothetical protein DVR14_19790 [Natrinema thermotolerans]QCC61635.1 hypothetical protein DVR14_23920 [Natrinema thermotolerans]WMT07803.1 hypothetical protein NP511_20815 [Natrinema thermotolerans]WMT08435.1 hypothetical protein NP511_02100 [Natrinema thermotolerans]
MTYGLHDALRDTVVDLRNYDDLVALLEDTSAIDEGWPKDPQEYPVVVRVQPVTETSNSQREFSTIERQFRLQVSVVAKDSWRSEQDAPTFRMAEIMAAVADRLDVAVDAPELLPSGTDSSSWTEVTGDRLALIQDWLTTTYTR